MRACSDIDIGRQGTAARLMAILDASQQQGISAEELTLNKSTWAGTARETLRLLCRVMRKGLTNSTGTQETFPVE